jgi:uncharacterized protein HemX
MPEERRLNQEARRRLDLIQIGYERFSRRVRVILAVLAVAQIGLGLLSIHLLSQNGDRARENSQLIEQVQAERAYAVRVQCNDVNRRNRSAQDELRHLVPAGTPARRVKPSQILIDKILPLRDCDQFVAGLVGHLKRP